MSFPWISRAEHERIVADLTRAVATFQGAMDVLQRTNDRLTGLVDRLSQPPVIVPTAPLTLPPHDPDPISLVIREQSFIDGHDDHDLARHLRNYAAMLKRDGLQPDEIVGKLVKWQSTEDGSLYDKVS